MPTYEYECEKCKLRFEKKQKFNEKPVATCPECEGKVRRVSQPAPIIFKGSGFYTTDNRKGSTADKAGEKIPGKGNEGKK